MKTRFSQNICALLPIVAVSVLAANSAVANPDYWNDASGNWSAGANWLSTAPPNPYDTLYFINSSATAYAPNDDFANGTPFDGIIFTNSTAALTLGGNSILISGQTNGANQNIGVANTTSLAETVNNNLAMDWGYYTFYSPGGSLALNGSMTANPGGVADFGPNNVTSASYVVDSTGLILGLGGAALIGNTSLGGGATGLATVSGGDIVPYTFSPNQQIPAGYIGATNAADLTNLVLTATSALNYSLAGGTGTTYGAPTNCTYFANIVVANNTTAKVGIGAINGGTIVMGTNEGTLYIGGIYLPNASTAQGITIGDGTSTFLTCGPMIAGNPIPGELIISIAGSNTSNEGEMNAVIKDNLGGGPVTVVYPGGGSMYINALGNSYSGGTYMIKGRVQCNQTNALGVGPVYIASGDAEISLQNVGNGVMPNNFFISPGSSYVGANTEGAVRLQGTGSTGLQLSGSFTLLGAPVAITNTQAGLPAIADRISDQSADPTTLAGQITGPGTLEFYAGANGMTFWLSNTTANANNWTGGLVVDGALNDSSDLKILANNQLGGNNVMPMAAGTGFGRLDLNGFSDTIGALNSISNSLLNQVADFGPAPSTLTIGANNASGNFYGTIEDNGNANHLSIVKIGTGTQVLSGVNTYVGNTFINGGTLLLTNTANINGSAQVAINGATLNETELASSAGANATFSLTNAIWDINVTQYGITNKAVGTLNLGGTTNIINVAFLPLITTYPSVFHLISYTTLNAQSVNVGLGSIPSVSPAYSAYMTNENGFIDLVISSGPPPVYQTGWTGTDPGNPTYWDIGTSLNWKTNGVATVYYNPDFALFNDSAPGQTTVNVTTTVTPGSVTVSNTVLQYTFNGSGSINNNTIQPVSLTKQGTNLLVIDENNGYTAGTFINNGIVQLGNQDGVGTLGSGAVVDNGQLIFNKPGNSQIFNNNISGTGTITEEGGDTLQLAGANTYTGNVLVTNNSTLQLGSYSALGKNPTTTTVANGSTLDINGYTAYGLIVAQGSGVGGNGAIVNNSADIAGTQAPAAVEYVGLTNLTLAGNITIGVNGSRFDLRSPAGTGGSPGAAFLSTGGQPYSITKVGDGGLAGNAGFFGVVSATVDPALANVDIQNGIFEMEGNTTGLGNPTNTVTIEGNSNPTLGTFQLFAITNRLNKVIVINDGATLWAASGNQTIIGPIVLTNSSGFSFDCNVNVSSGSLNLTGPLSGNGVLYKETGTNLLILSGVTTNFPGGVEVNAGVVTVSNILENQSGVLVDSQAGLNVDGVIEVGGVTNNAGGGVYGSGVISNALDNFGTVYPSGGGAPATLTVDGNLILESGCGAEFQLNYANKIGLGTNDLVAVNGNLVINGGTINVVLPGLLQDGVPYTIITYTGSLIGNASSLSVPGVDGYTFTLNTSTPGQINLVATGGPPVWSGGSTTDSDWSDPANWGGLTIGGNDLLYFAGNARLNNTNDTAAGTTYNNMVFAPTAGGTFDLNGTNYIQMSGELENNSAYPQIFDIPLAFNQPTTLSGGSSTAAPLIIGAGITNTASGFNSLYLTGNGIMTNLMASGASTDTNELFVSGANTMWDIVDNPSSTPISIPWALEITNGTLVFGNAGSAPNLTSLTQQGEPTDNQLGYFPGGTATLIVSNGIFTTTARMNTGPTGGSTGVVDVVGGTLSIASQFQGANGANTAGSIVNVSGGTFTTPGTLFVASRGVGTLSISGTGMVSCAAVDISRDADGSTGGSIGTVNLNGGTLSCTEVSTATANSQTPPGGNTPTATFNFNGGTLLAKGSSATFYQGSLVAPIIPVTTFIQGGGANINDGGFSIGINEVLQSGATHDGGLTKLGAGTVTLNRTNTYNGATAILGGTLALGAAGNISVSNTAPIIIASNATFNVSALASPFLLAANRVLTNSSSTAAIVGNFTVGGGTLSLTYAAGTPSLSIGGGTLTLAATNGLIIDNTSATPLPVGIYTIISSVTGGTVSGTLPSSFTVTGGGTQAGQPVVLQLANGALQLVVGTPALAAHITSINVSGTTLTLNATGGADGGQFVLLESTNIMLPVNQWTPVLTNNFDGSGNLVNFPANVVNPNVPVEFYLLQMP
ncbi:MAG TPA: autotransporter-associated beta strand repeat-containing protein [Alphaproteobacteria bacterium]|nr:autotransporter-associated beta strand repeat-containing protein [Alphaproteobacteria bacterium]